MSTHVERFLVGLVTVSAAVLVAGFFLHFPRSMLAIVVGMAVYAVGMLVLSEID